MPNKPVQIKIVLEGILRKPLSDKDKDTIYTWFDEALVKTEMNMDQLTFTSYEMYIDGELVEE